MTEDNPSREHKKHPVYDNPVLLERARLLSSRICKASNAFMQTEDPIEQTRKLYEFAFLGYIARGSSPEEAQDKVNRIFRNKLGASPKMPGNPRTR